MSHEAAGWETRKFAGPIWILPLRDCGSVLAVIANATVPAPVVLPRFEVIWIHPCAVAGAHSQVVATPNEPTPPATGTVTCAGVSVNWHVEPNCPITTVCDPIWIDPFRGVPELFGATAN